MTDETIQKLRAALNTAHDHLHKGNIEACHQAMHCAGEGKDVEPENITLDAAARMQLFTARFNQLCEETRVEAASIVLVPSKTPGMVSIQAGGHVPTIRFIGQMIDKNQVAALYQAERKERKAEEFAKRNRQN